jgi:hypothetical protein
MIKKKSEMPNRPIEIDLTGPDGNAFVLMAHARLYAMEMGKDSKAIIADMMSGDYEHLLEVFEQEFGNVVTLYR